MDSLGTDGFQEGGRAWSPSRPDILQILSSARHADVQPIYYGSNHTFLVTLDAGESGQSYAVYKPARGEYPLYDFASGTLYRREVATWLVDSILGHGLVPPTVVTHGKYGIGSLQLFIESASSAEVGVEELRRMALLDVLVNNADRKAEHCLPGIDGKVWAIDHGLTFHVQPKLRTVLWHFAAERVTPAERSDLRRFSHLLERRADPCVTQLGELLSRAEWAALRERVARLLASGRFPDPRYKAMPYRW